jgi:hypothetical protein
MPSYRFVLCFFFPTRPNEPPNRTRESSSQPAAISGSATNLSMAAVAVSKPPPAAIFLEGLGHKVYGISLRQRHTIQRSQKLFGPVDLLSISGHRRQPPLPAGATVLPCYRTHDPRPSRVTAVTSPRPLRLTRQTSRSFAPDHRDPIARTFNAAALVVSTVLFSLLLYPHTSSGTPPLGRGT